MQPGRHAHISVADAALEQAAGALDAFCAAERLPEHVVWRLRVALDEIVANIVAYGAQGASPAHPSAVIDVWLSREGEVVEITVADDGPAFNPLLRPDPDVTLPLEKRVPGGLGIALVKSLMDEVQYERTSRNVLTIRKRIETPPEGNTETDGHPT
ncbi:hypothetical protein BH24ACI5_BH24ACI5_13660 [soil metagenome]